MVDFNGWEMPIHYGSQIKEHEFVRDSCGIFDVSHMTIVDIDGRDAKGFLRFLLANDIGLLRQDFSCMYSALLNEKGGVIDDLIVYKMSSGYRLVVNCATRESDIQWLESCKGNMEVIISERNDLSILSIQGPRVFETLSNCFSSDLSSNLRRKKSFQGLQKGGTLITTTGYTGEIGVEVMIEDEGAKAVWKKALLSGAKPIGLGARDTLRLEAGMNLYGSEMDEDTSPLECNMAWTVSLEDGTRDFIGKESFKRKKEEGNFDVLKGLLFEDRSIVRSHQVIYFDESKELKGFVTSGSYSPTLKKSIALARIPSSSSETCMAEVRGKTIKASIGEPRFVREGKIIFKG